jgi:D-alanyl-D-alanine carboxypeptidase/D-alanyl-D-alanine-endopeptidase (penicillin-binding protein 4)
MAIHTEHFKSSFLRGFQMKSMNSICKSVIYGPIFASLVFSFSSISVAGFDTSYLSKKFSATKAADHSVIFSRISDGKTLFELGADTQLSPASVTKVITSAAALYYFGPAFNLKTPVYYSGKLDKGKITGDLFIKGNGDPFLVSEILWQMAVDLRHLGVREIAGSLVIDNSLFDDENRDESRLNSTNKSSHAYDAPVSAFAVNFNTIAVATAGTKPGKLALAGVSPFPMNNAKLVSRTSTTKGDSSGGVTLTRNSAPNGGVSLISGGTIGVDAPLKKIYRSVGDPVVSSGDYVVGFLKEAGIRIRGKVKSGAISADAKLIYELSGYEMRKVTQGLNTFSNNFIADMLTKRLAAGFLKPESPDLPGSGSLAGGARVLSQFLEREVGVKGEFKILNGSGLSTENRLSSRQVLSVLNWMEKRGDLFPDFLASLPATGWDGTVKKRLKQSESLAGIIRAKSGTLTEPITVAALAGYFRHPREGWVSFSIISNGREGKGQPGLMDLRNLQDDVLKGILSE